MIELLVVISIIALLVAILLPALQQARAAGRQIKCLSNLRQLGLSMNMYADDYDDWFPPFYTSMVGFDWPNGPHFEKKWPQLLCDLGYTGTSWDQAREGASAYSTIFWCPEDQRDMMPPPPGGQNQARNDPSYYINMIIANTASGYRWLRRGDFETPTRTMHLVDGRRPNDDGEFDYTKSTYTVNPLITDGWRNIDFRHMKRNTTQVLYADGHASTRSDPDIPTTASDPFWGGP